MKTYTPEQYKKLNKIILSDYYDEFIDYLWRWINPPGSHMGEMIMEDINEFILDVIVDLEKS